MFDDMRLPGIPALRENEKVITEIIVKVEEVGKSLSGSLYVDIHLANGAVVETAITKDKFIMMKTRLLETAVFMVRDLGNNRYESDCIILGKEPKYDN